jgi:hypothetical protein
MRYAQRRHSDAAELAMELLRHTRDPASRRNLNLMLADCALELNNLAIAQSALASVGGAMPLRDTLKLMELQVEYCARIGAWPQVIDQLPTKVELAELLATEPAQRVQALMALAALKQGRPDWAAWLRRRVELLGDITSLLNRRPALSDLFA